ncbi:MAG TPA: sensor histidine kinase [Phenylobacterium sp.]|nr:sensor histidine kinase [Phenylobacterium sp.]
MSIQWGVIAGLAVLTIVLASIVLVRRGDRRAAAGRFAELAELNARLVVALAEKTEAEHDLGRVVAERTAALEQRDLLLREVYHRVKNNLQVVDSLIVLQAKRLADPAARSAFEDLRARLFALGLVHHQLMGSGDLETFEVVPFLEQLSERLRDHAGGDVGLSVRAAPLKVGLDFAIPLGLLVTELVNDAVAHARPDHAPAIEVELAEGGVGELVLQVRDDGSPDRGGPGEPQSLGATIIHALVAQLRGVLTVSTSAGVRSEVRMPSPAIS